MRYTKCGLLAALALVLVALRGLPAQEPRSGAARQTTPLKVYGHLLNPREHPDDARRAVRPPDWSVFGDRTHFTTMRQFQITDSKLVNYADDFERYTKTFDLGDVIWPNSRFLTATNIPDMVEEMKRRNLGARENVPSSARLK
jgi:hypothetical protein